MHETWNCTLISLLLSRGSYGGDAEKYHTASVRYSPVESKILVIKCFRFTPESGQNSRRPCRSACAISGLVHCGKRRTRVATSLFGHRGGASVAAAPVTAVCHPSFCIPTRISCAPYRAGLWHRLDPSTPWRLPVYLWGWPQGRLQKEM